MASLYEISEEVVEVMELLGGKIEGEEEERLKFLLDGLREDIYKKAEGYGKAIRNKESDVAALEEEIKRLQERKLEVEDGIVKMKETIKIALQSLDLKKVDTLSFKYSLRNSAPSLVIEVPEDIPEEFTEEVPKKLNKKRLLAWVKEHEDECTFARLDRKISLQMK